MTGNKPQAARARDRGLLAVLLAATVAHPLITPRTLAQSPGLLWATNVSARVFAVDGHTNVYADAGGQVIQLDRDGTPLQTNFLSSYPGLAQRDVAGNFYYSGNYPGTPNGFGLVYTNPACFVSKYTAAGNLVWTTAFGPINFLRSVLIRDLQVDPNGNICAGYTLTVGTTSYTSWLAKFDAAGTNLWLVGLPKVEVTFVAGGNLRLGALSSDHGYALTFPFSQSFPGNNTTLSQFDTNGAMTVVSNWRNETTYEYPRPIKASTTGLLNTEGPRLTRRDATGALVWSREIDGAPQYAVGPDQWEGVHLAREDGLLSRRDSDGNLVWTLNLPSRCNAMVVDAQGNRFLSLANGVVARLGSETLSAPSITRQPPSQTVFQGSKVDLMVSASGTTPLRYTWWWNDTRVAYSSNGTLTLPDVTSAQGGFYSVIVSNFMGSVTSAPAILRVKAVAFYWDSQLLTNDTYDFVTPPTLAIHSAFTNGPIFYTLDGSVPSFGSTRYSAPLTLKRSATLRAIGYSADFLQSEEADAVRAIVAENHSLAASASFGGSVNLDPPGGTYVVSDVVTATAIPASGWSFLYWLGDAAGGNPVTPISMERDKTLRAVFGTTLSITTAGVGQVLLDPPGGVYPFGTSVRLTGVPQPGSYFGAWGNAATGNNNPLDFTIAKTSPTVSCIFGLTPSNQSALTVLIDGHGQVRATPRANVYATNQTVTLTATPDSGQAFLNWAGAVDGTLNPLALSMVQSRVITAHFTSEPQLRVDRRGLEGLTPDGFRLTLVGDLDSVHQILASTNLIEWDALGSLTNVFNEAQFTDRAATNFPFRIYRAVTGR